MNANLLRLFTDDIEDAICDMGFENAGIIMTAMVMVNNGKPCPEIPEHLNLFWKVIYKQIIRNAEYIEGKREAGRKGGLSKASSAKQCLANVAQLTTLPDLTLPHQIKKNTYGVFFEELRMTYRSIGGRRTTRMATSLSSLASSAVMR